MTPNQVTAARVGAAFAAVAMFRLAGDVLAADFAAVLLTITAIALDGLDGYLARRRGLSTPLGAQIDILGDRIVENLFFTCFAVSGLVSLWVPVMFFARGAITDFLRGLAARQGRSGFGSASMLETWWGRGLVASRVSRGAYAVLKCVCFCYLGLLFPLRQLPATTLAPWLPEFGQRGLLTTGRVLVGVTLGFCLVRAIPVIWEGRGYFLTTEKATTVMASEAAR
jgi:CDP-diacylglycerol---glycerol-3-phosphate 3-phosphatidyltransferase